MNSAMCKSIMHYEQLRFVSVCKTGSVFQKSIYVIHDINRLKEKKNMQSHAIVLIDVEKGSDNIE